MNHQGHEGTRRRTSGPANLGAFLLRSDLRSMQSASAGRTFMFCSRCGQTMPDGATLCATCGQQFVPTDAPLTSLSPRSPQAASIPGSPVPQKTSGMAIASLIFGILFIFFPLSIPGLRPYRALANQEKFGKAGWKRDGDHRVGSWVSRDRRDPADTDHRRNCDS